MYLRGFFVSVAAFPEPGNILFFPFNQIIYFCTPKKTLAGTESCITSPASGYRDTKNKGIGKGNRTEKNAVTNPDLNPD